MANTSPLDFSGNTLRFRLEFATEAERGRLCLHLGVSQDSTVQQLEQAYVSAADNSIFVAARGLLPSTAPTYSKALRLIYKELRPYSEALDETWQRVKKLKLRNYESPIDQLDDAELEDLVLTLYSAEYKDVKDEVERQQSTAGKVLKPIRKLGAKVARWIPGGGAAAVSSAVAVSAHTAARLPFAAAAPGAVAGPVGIALSVVYVGSQLAGPAYRKIVPATVELMLIGRRIGNMPEE